jgi:hypothetical protein
MSLKLYGYDDGMFSGPFLIGSEMNIRGRSFTEPTITLEAPTPARPISWGAMKAAF